MVQLPRKLRRSVRRLVMLLEFHPWMLALIVFLACAIGVTVMEQLRDRPQVVAQASVQAPGRPGR